MSERESAGLWPALSFCAPASARLSPKGRFTALADRRGSPIPPEGFRAGLGWLAPGPKPPRTWDNGPA